MRCLPALVALGAALTGCTADCGLATSFNQNTYRVFANPVTWDSSNDLFTQGPDYWSYGTPANGTSTWQIQWGAAPVGPVTVVIDGQQFQGQGELDQRECGQGTATFSGTYLDEDRDVEHTFNASMSFALWSEDTGGKLGAFLVWKESWTHPSGENGQFSASSHLTGELAGQGAAL